MVTTSSWGTGMIWTGVAFREGYGRSMGLANKKIVTERFPSFPAPEQIVADLQAEIERVKAHAAAREAWADPQTRAVLVAAMGLRCRSDVERIRTRRGRSPKRFRTPSESTRRDPSIERQSRVS
jgi:hypothetical protein